MTEPPQANRPKPIVRLAVGLVMLLMLRDLRVQAAPPAGAIDFNRDIQPILADTCYQCHGPDAATREAELRLDRRESAFAMRDSGPTIVPGDLQRSVLYQRISHADSDQRMPPADSGLTLSPEQVALVARWIRAGAKWQDHWSLITPVRPKLPAVRDASWPRGAIDTFVLARLEREGLRPAPRASKATLIRRASLDLTGLPPTIDQIDAFLADDAPGAYERVVDRLFASPRYGERMVLPWLDAARYSDTNGYQTDGTRAMWPWRDWIIGALNANMPFDQFTIEQIAGDMLPGATLDQKIATGLNRNHMLNGEGGRIAEESRVEYVIDRLTTTGTIWLGLTIGCGRCHDHKYDPISQREFYQLYAYFNSVDETGAVDRRSATASPTITFPTDAQKVQQAELEQALAQLETKRMQFAGEGEKTNELDQQIRKTNDRLAKLKKSMLLTMVMRERDKPRETFILTRGQYNKPGPKVEPGVPACLPPLPAGARNNRLGFARWLVDRSHPLTARVTVNRYWQLFFGTGLVKTTEDFGLQGERPSHAELLDWLAVEFSEDWNVKRLQRLIVTSAAYRQHSAAPPERFSRDPQNRLLARGPRLRLGSLTIRDQALFLAGLLVEQQGGPPVKPYQPAGVWADFSLGKMKYEQDSGAGLYRRSLYTFWRRSVGPTAMFDTSPRQVCTVRPRRTNTPLHALILLNDTTFVEAARAFAQRLIEQGGKTPAERIAWAFRAATSRPPGEAERRVLLAGFQRVLAQYQGDPKAAGELIQVGESKAAGALDPVELAAYTAVAGTILNLDEVITKH